jgi:hypothetical protein
LLVTETDSVLQTDLLALFSSKDAIRVLVNRVQGEQDKELDSGYGWWWDIERCRKETPRASLKSACRLIVVSRSARNFAIEDKGLVV